ncbi:MAG: trimethylamine methyltransferase family protein [Dehalococcoidales bacterium]|nr:trimethylamine methyltransferase family protein [Dehalococcoidales bacterium]
MPREGILVHNPYRRMTDEQIRQIHQASVGILTNPGLVSFNREAVEILSSSGAEVSLIADSDNPCWTVKIPERLVLQALDSAPKTVKLGARNRDNILIMNGDEPRVFLVSGSETNIWLDVDFPTYVKKAAPSVEVSLAEFHQQRGTVSHLCQAARLAEHLETLDAFIRPVNIQDKDITIANKDVNKFFASLNNTTKHVMAGLTSLDQLDNVINMAQLIVGGEEALRDNPIISFITCLVKSPLQLVDDTTQTAIEICRRGLPLVVSSSPQAGSTAPIKEDGIIVQINAEILAGITLSQLVNAGSPIIYGAVPVRARLDNLADSYGAPETSQYNIDCVQMARYYRLPCYATSGVSDTKVPGMQSAIERLFSDTMVALSGPQYLHCAYGLLDGNSIFCPLQAVLDDAHFQILRYFLTPALINQEELAQSVKQITEVAGASPRVYIRYIRSVLRRGRLSMPYPFEAEGRGDSVLALAYQRMNRLMAEPVDHIDSVTTDRIFCQIPGILPRLNIYWKGKGRE